MEPWRPFLIQIDDITVAQNFGGNTQLHFDNLPSLMHFLFSLDPHQLVPFDQPKENIRVVLPIEQGGSAEGNIRFISSLSAEKEHLVPGVYFTFRSGMNTIWGATGFNMELMESDQFPFATIQLARYYPNKEQFEWAPGYAHLKHQVLTTMGSEQSLSHPFVATVTIQGHDYSDPQKRQEYRTCHYFPSLPSAVLKALTTDFFEFQPQLIHNGKSPLSSISLHTTDLLSADFYLYRCGIENVMAGDGPPIPGIYLTFDMNQFPEPEDIERKFKWILNEFDHWIPEMYAVLISRETYDENYDLTHDPRLYSLVDQCRNEAQFSHYQLQVKGTYQQDDLSPIPPNFTNIYHYPNFQEAMDHLLSINPRSLDLQYVKANNETLFISEVSLKCLHDIRYEMVVTRDLHNKWMMGKAGAFLVCERPLQGAATQFYQDDRLPPVVQLAGYTDGFKELQSYQTYLQMQNNALALHSSVTHDQLVSRYGERQPDDKPGEEPIPTGFFLVVISGRMDITGVERNIFNNFDAAYKHLATLPAESLLRTSPGGYEDAKIFDHNGALLVSRYDHPGDVIIPSSIYTIVHCENISPDVLKTISADLTIIGSHEEKFICRSASQNALQLQMRPSPLRVSDIKDATTGPHL